MSKKILSLVLILIMIMTSGCSAGENIDLTEEQSNAIAQYSAYLIMKYDKNKLVNEKLLDMDDLQDIKEEEELANATPTPTEAPTPTPEPTKKPEKPSKGDKDKTETETLEPTKAADDSSEGNSSDAPSAPSTTKYAKSLGEFFDGSFDIEYKSYSLNDSYTEGDYLTLQAPKNKKILILNFDIVNKSKKDQTILYNNNLVYSVLYKNGGYEGSEMTLLENGLLYINEKIKAGQSYRAVLMFYVSDTQKEYTFRATDGVSGKVYDIKIK